MKNDFTTTKIYPKDRKILKEKAHKLDMTMPEYLEFIFSDEFTVGVTAGSDGVEKHYSKGATKIFFEDFIYEKDGVELVYGDIVVAVVKVDHKLWDKEMEKL